MKYFLFVILILFEINSFSQTIKEIKLSDQYYWGQGSGKNLDIADKNALKDLISQISVQIEHSMKSVWTEENGDFKEYTKSVTNTYSGATLNRAERKVEESENGVTVIRYITKQKMEEVYSDRKNKIFDFINSAKVAEKELRIGDALKYYFWSLALLRSHPDCSKIKYNVSGTEELLLLTALPDKINTILTALNVEVKNITEDKEAKNTLLKVSYQNQAVMNFDFSYWTGDTWTTTNSTKNGFGAVELTGEAARSFTDLRLRAEYTYLNNSSIDNELQNVLENTSTPFFKKSEYKIPIKKVVEETKTTDNVIIEPLNNNVIVTDYETSINKIKLAITSKNFSSVKSMFTDDGYLMYEKLITYGNAKILPQNNILKAVQFNGNVVVRSVPMSFSFKKNNRKFVEEVSFSFNADKKINSVSFTLSEKAISDIMSKSDEFAKQENKYQLLQFMEDYKTAYCLGRIDFIEQVFAENALIIVGHVLKTENKNVDKMYAELGEQNVKYIKYSKKEYIEKMKSAFQKNEFINIQFDENTVKKARPDKKVYGIQIAQNWYSTNYADKGYLFLMIDLNDSLNPKIYVRTWQPTKNTDGSIYGISDFHF